jgi:hypothetical protein
MKGYTRSPAETERLLAALSVALYANPDQRLGQLLLNTARNEYGEQPSTSRLWKIHDEAWIEDFLTNVPNEERQRVGSTFRVHGLPCPVCKQYALIGYLYTNENGQHMHTRYVCTFWRSGVKEDLSGATYEPCNWSGGTVPGWDLV